MFIGILKTFSGESRYGTMGTPISTEIAISPNIEDLKKLNNKNTFDPTTCDIIDIDIKDIDKLKIIELK